MPALPGKTFFKLSSNVDLDKRRIDLNNYVKDLANRPDLRTNQHFREFLELDMHMPESVCYSPIKVGMLEGLFFGGRDCIYDEEASVMFVIQSKMNIGDRVDSYLSNITMPWENSNDSVSPVGALSVYQVSHPNDEWKFKLNFTMSYTSQTNILHWNKES